MEINDLDNGFKRLRSQVPESDTASLYNAILHKALEVQATVIQFNQLKKIAAAAAVLILINVSVVFWSLKKDNTDEHAVPDAGYLQSYNLSIY